MRNAVKFISAPYVIDRKLYKYYSNVGYAIDSLKKGRIHLDNPQKFNDPFEAKWQFSYYTLLETEMTAEAIYDENFEYLKALPVGKQSPHHSNIITAMAFSSFPATYGSSMLQINDGIRKIYNGFGLSEFTYEEFCDEINEGFMHSDGFLHLECKMSCFAEVCDSILMWSYYANSHRGVCLEYDLSRLDTSVSLNREILGNLSKVHYSPIRSDLQHAINDEREYNFLISKADVWAHEHEWRLICETDDEYLPFDCVSRVILGVNFNKESNNYKELQRLCKSIDIDQCKLSREKFKIEFETVFDSVYHQYLEKALEYAGTP